MEGQILIEVEITFLPTAEGGRNFPDGILQTFKYRPHIVIGDPMQRKAIIANENHLIEKYLGVVFIDGPNHIENGRPNVSKMVLMNWPHPDYETVIPEANFTLREASKIIAYGKILKRWTEEAKLRFS